MICISDGSDLRGVTRAQDIKYVRYLRWIFKCIGAWPGHVIGEPRGHVREYKWYLFLNSASTLVAGILFIRNNFSTLTFFEMGQNYITVSMTVICLCRCIIIRQNKYEMTFKNFLNKIHLTNHRNKSAYYMKMHLYIHKLSHLFTVYSIVSMLWGQSLFNLIPLHNTIKAGGFRYPPPENITYEVSVYFALPFDYQHAFTGYIIIYIFDVYECFLAASYFCIFDMYLALIMFQLWGHLKILIHELESFPKPANRFDNYTNEEMLNVTQKLKDIVDHHNLIISFTDEVSDTFGLAIAISYAFHQVSGCVLLLECSQLDPKAIIRFGPLTMILLQLLAQMSLIFELIKSMNDELVNAAYFLPWEYMDILNKKSVLSILRQIQKPLGLKAVGMVEAGCQTMVTILKTTFSYFVMLRTMEIE